MIDNKALEDMSYGLFVITSVDGGKNNGLIANSVFQVTAQPPKIAIAVNKESLTHEYIMGCKKFCAMPIAESADMFFIGNFGFRTGRTFDKFAKINYRMSDNGLPIVTDHTLAAIEAQVEQAVDLGTHTMFVGLITKAQVLTDGNPLTYAYYHGVLKGKTPQGATTFRKEESK